MMNKITLTTLIFLVSITLTFSACSAAPDPASLAGSSWTLISYGPADRQDPVVTGIPTSLVFDSNGQVSGSLGCNNFSGNYALQNGKLVFSALASTLMACPEAQMSQEEVAFQVLSGTVRFVLSGSTLTIYDVGGTNALTLSRAIN